MAISVALLIYPGRGHRDNVLHALAEHKQAEFILWETSVGSDVLL